MTVSQESKESLNLESLTWGGLTWVNIEQPTRRETEYLAKNYPFHPLDLDDCLSRTQRPKIDEYEDYLFLVLHFPRFHKEAGVTTPSQVSVFIGEKYMVTLHNGELNPLVKLFRQCQIDQNVRQEHFSQGSGYLLYRLLDRLVDYLFPILDKILEAVDNTEGSVFDGKGVITESLATLRRDIIAQRRIIWPMRAVIGSLQPKLKRFSQMDLDVYFGDMVDHMDRVWDILDECKEVIEVFKDTDYTLSTNKTNRILALLTILATLSIPAMVIGTLYGMNVNLPGGVETKAWSFLGPYTTLTILLIFSVIPAGLMFWVFRRWRWI